MRQALQTLIELAQIDEELLVLELSRGDLPKRVEQLKTELQRQQEKSDALHASVETSQQQKRLQEGELAELKEKLKKYQQQLFQVKNNKEYDAITLEIEQAESNAETLEFNNLELDERIEASKVQLQSLQEELEHRRQELAVGEEQLHKVLSRTAEQEALLKQKRQRFLNVLNVQIYSQYERIRRGRGGSAVAYLANGACSACSSRIPPQRGMEIRMMNHLYVCEVCGRILVWVPDKEVAGQEK
ncbi:MAG TPA: hypothetical protein PKN04_03950 [bacterium]|nr:hypothetical protein [bacterium]HNT64911.1 hypothetical protein [bacterium]HOX84922.1 hypothetical protein [bacterium]HPG44212.1 hypothetical protein [bacterium]HPM96579.1 hypothetical protein [bacterium]